MRREQVATHLNTEDTETQCSESGDDAATHRVRTIFDDAYDDDGLVNTWVIGKDTGEIILSSRTTIGENNNVSQTLPDGKRHIAAANSMVIRLAKRHSLWPQTLSCLQAK